MPTEAPNATDRPTPKHRTRTDTNMPNDIQPTPAPLDPADDATQLRTYLETNPDGFELDEFGTIRSPGKFEAEPLHVPYFYGIGLDGFADATETDGNGNTVEAFFLSDGERAILAERDAIGASDDTIALTYRDSGFVDGWSGTRDEWNAHVAEWAEDARLAELDAESDDDDSIEEYDPEDYHGTAARWHSGQWSALYAFLSSGTVTHGLTHEVRQNLAHIESSDPSSEVRKGNEEECLSALLAHVEPIEDALPCEDETDD